MLQENYRPEINLAAIQAGSRQRRRLRLAFLALLFAALILLVKYQRPWVQSVLTAGLEKMDPAASDQSGQQATPATPRRARSKPHQGAAVASASDERATVTHEIGERAVRTPLQVEVVYGGGRHRTLQTRDSSINLDLQQGASAAPAEGGAEAATAMTDAADRVRLSPETLQAVVRPVEPKYPLQARQMNVEGSVVLLAHIDKDGNVQDLQVLSGPDVLAAAAQEAVRQWRFRPHLENGRAVESEARVTVNFTISSH